MAVQRKNNKILCVSASLRLCVKKSASALNRDAFALDYASIAMLTL